MKKTLDYQKELIKSLKDPRESVAYLNVALIDEDPKIFLLALKNVLEAHGGLGKVSKKTKLNRENLYRMLSDKGNPEFSSIYKLLNSIGLQLSVQPDGRA